MSDPMAPVNRVGPGGARWCDEHGRYECTRNRTKGRGQCHQAAIRGTSACQNHGGISIEAARAKGEAITAWSALGADPSVDPATAVLGMLHVSWLRVHLYAGLLQAQVEAQGGSEGDVPADPGNVPPEAGDGPRQGGLIGHTYAPARGGEGRVVTGEAPRGLVMLEAAERDRVVRFAKVAHDMGISERQTQLAEAQAVMLARVLRRVLERLELAPERLEQAQGWLAAELEAVALGGAA